MTNESRTGEIVPIGVEALQVQAAAAHEAARLLASYGYEGLTLDQLVMQIRQRVQRSTEDILEIGRAVCCLRELPRGQYGEAIKAIGLSADTARRMASVALKFLGKDHLKPLLDLDVSKVYELALLDDGELDELATDAAQLDKVDRMSVSELRLALRAARHDGEAKDARLKDVHQENAALRDEKASRTKYTPDQAKADEQRRQAARSRALHEGALQAIAQFNHWAAVLNDVLDGADDAEREHALSSARWLAQQIGGLYLAHGIDVDFAETITPSWTKLATVGEG